MALATELWPIQGQERRAAATWIRVGFFLFYSGPIAYIFPQMSIHFGASVNKFVCIIHLVLEPRRKLPTTTMWISQHITQDCFFEKLMFESINKFYLADLIRDKEREEDN